MFVLRAAFVALLLIFPAISQAQTIAVTKVDPGLISITAADDKAGGHAADDSPGTSNASKVDPPPSTTTYVGPCGRLFSAPPGCVDPQPDPGTPADPPPPPEFTPADARQAATQITLPPPQPDIRPGMALCGLPMYLTIAGAGTYPTNHELNEWNVTFHNTLTNYTINWGDNTENTTTTSRGAPYPNGDITHYWTHRGNYTITVTAHWHSEWTATHPTAGTRQGTINDLATTNTIPDFPVRELQAVITT